MYFRFILHLYDKRIYYICQFHLHFTEKATSNKVHKLIFILQVHKYIIKLFLLLSLWLLAGRKTTSKYLEIAYFGSSIERTGRMAGQRGFCANWAPCSCLFPRLFLNFSCLSAPNPFLSCLTFSSLIISIIIWKPCCCLSKNSQNLRCRIVFHRFTEQAACFSYSIDGFSFRIFVHKQKNGQMLRLHVRLTSSRISPT